LGLVFAPTTVGDAWNDKRSDFLTIARLRTAQDPSARDRHAIVRDYPYGNVESCEYDQTRRFTTDGFVGSFGGDGMRLGLGSLASLARIRDYKSRRLSSWELRRMAAAM
jgi:hypothetical protein